MSEWQVVRRCTETPGHLNYVLPAWGEERGVAGGKSVQSKGKEGAEYVRRLGWRREEGGRREDGR